MATIFGVAAIDQSDGTTYTNAVTRTVAAYNTKAGFVYYSPSTAPHWTDKCNKWPSDHDLFVSVKKYTSDSQWINDHQTFADEIPSRTGKVYMVCNEEPEPDMTSTEFKRRWDLVKTIWQSHPYAVMAVQLTEYTFNPQSGRLWSDWVPSYVGHVGVSFFAYEGDINNDDPTPHYEMAGRVITPLTAAGKTFSFSSVGCGAKNDGTQPLGGTYRKRRAQWCYDLAEDAMLSGAKHYMWFDFDQGSVYTWDTRLRTDTDLDGKYDSARADFSSQEGGGRSGPEFRAEAHASTGTGAAVATLNVTVPTTGIGGPVTSGDKAYIFWSEVNGGLITGATVPSGWTELIAPTAFNGSTQAIALARKTLAPADIGATINYGTLSSTRRQNVLVVVYSNAAHDALSSVSSSAVGTLSPPVPGLTPGGSNPKAVSFAAVQHPANNTNLMKGQSATNWTDRIDQGTSTVASFPHGSQYVQDRQFSGAGAISATTFATNFSAQYVAFTLTLLTDVTGTTVTPAGFNVVTSMTKANVAVGVIPAVLSVVTQAFPSATVVDIGRSPSTFVVTVGFPTPTTPPPFSISGDVYFTPPHRGKFCAYFDIEIPESLTEPFLSMTPHTPQPPNLWLDPDTGLLTTNQPRTQTPDTKVFLGGHIYGPLSQADIDLLINSGYGVYLTSDPLPTPQP